MIDPLSSLLSTLKVDSMLSVQLEMHGSWAFRYPAFRHMKFGGVAEGERWIWIEGKKPVLLQTGDFYLLTNGQPYCTASDLEAPLMDGVAALSSLRQSASVRRYGEGEPKSVVASGRFTFASDEMLTYLSFLPPLIHISAGRPESADLANLLPLIMAETRSTGTGQSVAASNIASLVLVHIIRAHMACGTATPSWMVGANDRKIGPLLARMHNDVSRRWTTSELSGEVGMSRSAFTKHFGDCVGMPPLTYLTQWRMTLAKAALRDGERNIENLAQRLGYGSSTAFSLAFKREVGTSPGRYRSDLCDR